MACVSCAYICMYAQTSTIYIDISVLFLLFMGEATTVVVVKHVCVERRDRGE